MIAHTINSLERIYGYFKSINLHKPANSTRRFINLATRLLLKNEIPSHTSLKEATDYEEEMRSHLSYTDPEAAHWLSNIAEVRAAIAKRGIETQPDEYIFQSPGKIRVRAWDKRRWNEAPVAVKQTIQPYLEAGWDLDSCDLSRKFYTIVLSKCDGLYKKDEKPQHWHHYKELMLSAKPKTIGKLLYIRNGRSHR